jgi:hypothetical protein
MRTPRGSACRFRRRRTSCCLRAACGAQGSTMTVSTHRHRLRHRHRHTNTHAHHLPRPFKFCSLFLHFLPPFSLPFSLLRNTTRIARSAKDGRGRPQRASTRSYAANLCLCQAAGASCRERTRSGGQAGPGRPTELGRPAGQAFSFDLLPQKYGRFLLLRVFWTLDIAPKP